MDISAKTTTRKKSLQSLLPQLASIAAFLVYKILYPYPDITLDSLNYIEWGLNKFPVAYRPVGYSQFLAWFEGMENVHLIIVIIQFAAILAGFTFFNNVVFRTFKFSRPQRLFTYCLTIFNPLVFIMANSIMPDALFLGIATIWLTSLMLIMMRSEKTYLLIAVNVLCFYLSFPLRFNAIYYPVILIAAAVLCRKSKETIILVAATLILCVILYRTTVEKTREFTGTETLTGFAGWTLANNALHVYDVTEIDTAIFDSDEERILNRYTLLLKDSIQYDRGKEVTANHLWNKHSPLRVYLAYKIRQGYYLENYFVGWFAVSDLYASFGTKIILAYPFAFFRAYLLPNFISYFTPDPEVHAAYNRDMVPLAPKIRAFLDIHSNYLPADTGKLQERTVMILRWIYLPINILVIVSLLIFTWTWVRKRVNNEGIKTAALFYFIILFLAVFSHPIAMRYVAVLLLPGSVFPLIFLAWRRNNKSDAPA